MALVHVDPASALRLASTWSCRRSLTRPGCLRKGEPGQGETQQPKVLVSISSGIALVSGQCLAALPTQSDQILFGDGDGAIFFVNFYSILRSNS